MSCLIPNFCNTEPAPAMEPQTRDQALGGARPTATAGVRYRCPANRNPATAPWMSKQALTVSAELFRHDAAADTGRSSGPALPRPARLRRACGAGATPAGAVLV